MPDTDNARRPTPVGVQRVVGLYYRARKHVRTSDERECFICRGRGQVQHCGGHMLKWYRCKHCDGYGSVKRKANAPAHLQGRSEAEDM